MKKRLISILLLFSLFSLIFIAGCGISKEEAMVTAEERIGQEFNDFSNDIVSYEIEATNAVKSKGNWEVMVNVTIVERIAATELFTSVDGYYLVTIDKSGEILSSELKQIGAFRPS